MNTNLYVHDDHHCRLTELTVNIKEVKEFASYLTRELGCNKTSVYSQGYSYQRRIEIWLLVFGLYSKEFDIEEAVAGEKENEQNR